MRKAVQVIEVGKVPVHRQNSDSVPNGRGDFESAHLRDVAANLHGTAQGLQLRGLPHVTGALRLGLPRGGIR